MIKTMSIKDLETKATNIYEAIIVIAKRARQINDEQRQMTSSEKEYDEDYDDYPDEEGIIQANESFVNLPKPALVSLEEFMDGKLKHDYEPSSETEENDHSSK